MNPLVLSNACLVSCLGAGMKETLEALRAGRSGLRPGPLGATGVETFLGAVSGLDEAGLDGALEAYDCRNNRLAHLALVQDGFNAAVEASMERHGAHRVGVFVGTSTAGIRESELAFRHREPGTGKLPGDYRYRGAQNTYSIADFVQKCLGLEGPALVVSAACASTAKVFGVAARMIEAGLCDAAIVGGADSLCMTTLHGFHALQLLDAGPCRPFDANRNGISIGEAAGFVLLERPDAANEAADILLRGVGESSDAYHMSSPHPDGLGALRAMELALASAQLGPAAVDYVNLHGTATRVGDAAEDRAVAALFGDATACSSTKGLTGHALGASGIVEVLLASLCVRHGFIPPSSTTQQVDPAFALQYCLGGEGRRIRTVLSNSFGFGGSNCSVVLGSRE